MNSTDEPAAPDETTDIGVSVGDLQDDALEIDDAQIEVSQTIEIRIPRLYKNRSRQFVGGIAIAIALVVLGAYLNLLPWLAVVAVVIALVATLFERGQRVTGGAGVVAGLILIASLGGGREPNSPTDPATATEAPTTQQPVPGSLGVYVEDLADLWNTVTNPPDIGGAFTRYTESGDYDSFIYRFGDWGRLAGAYDRSNEAVHGLLATGQLSNPATADLYLHLCFVVSPYSAECMASYFEEGLAGGTLADFVDQTHSSEWMHGEHTWSVEIERNIATIRVLSGTVNQ